MTKHPIAMDFAELKRRSLAVRAILEQFKPKIKLKPGEGLEKSLAEAEAISDAISKGETGNNEAFAESAKAASVIWNLIDTLQPCLDHGLDLNEHLKQMTTGSVNYGIPATGAGRKPIYFKDFEMELFAASQCIKRKLPVKLNEVANDPRGDLLIEPLRLEVKHPDAPNQLEKLIRKFNSLLRNEGRYGVFVAGLEDAFNLEPNRIFQDEDEWTSWLQGKAEEIEAFGRSFLRFAATMTRVLVTVQTWTIWCPIQGTLNLRRQSNSIVFDDRKNVPADVTKIAAQIAAVFNPQFRMWSEIKPRVLEVAAAREKDVLRRSVRERAYQIWEEENFPENRAWQHWFQARNELGVPSNCDI